MKKESIEIFRDIKQLSGYSYLIIPKQISPEGILDSLVRWSKNKKVSIYSHNLRGEEQNFDQYKDKYKVKGFNLEIPYCDWVYYLDIWYQEK